MSENRFWGKVFLQKLTSYGTSGRSAKGKMLVRWSFFFHPFFKNWTFTIKTWLLLRVFDLNPSLSWKGTFSFGAIWDLFLEEYIAPWSEGDLRGRGSLRIVSFWIFIKNNNIYLQSRVWGSIVGDLLTAALLYGNLACQKYDLYLVFLISTTVCHAKALFHLEPSEVYVLKNI